MASDLALLTRWANRREAQAFKEIVSRYAPMVYATCVRVLGDPHEAEDVAQECFETLVKTSKKPEKHLGAWLHRVATNRSLDRIRSEQRRRIREKDFVEQHKASVQVQWDDIYDHIDGAIAELPEEFRIPIVAHYLQDQKHAAIARSLKVSRRTVARHITRGTEMLARSLQKRGVTLSIGALTALMTANLVSAAPVPAGLSAALGKLALAQAGASATSGAVVESGLIAGIGTVKILAIGLAIVGVAAVVGVILLESEREQAATSVEVAPENQEPIPPPSPGDSLLSARIASPVPEEPAVTAGDTSDTSDTSGTYAHSGAAAAVSGVLSGRVVDSDGRGVARADIDVNSSGEGIVATALTDAEGRFELANLKPGTMLDLVIKAKGYNTCRRTVETPPDGGSREILVVLERVSSISGQVVDVDRRPLPNVWVQLERNPGKNGPWYYGEGSEKGKSADFMGRFTLTGVAPGIYTFLVNSAQFTTNALNEPVELAAGQNLQGLVVVVPISRELGIQGYVSDENGYVIEGVQVLADSIYGFHRVGDGSLVSASATTNASGFYRIDGVADPVDLLFEPPAGSGYGRAWLSNITPGTLDADVVLRTAGGIAGIVVDAQSSQPLQDFTVEVWRVDSIDGEEGPQTAFGEVQEGEAPGTFVISGVAPGTVQLYAQAPGHAGRIVRDIQVENGETTGGIEIALGAPCILEGRILMDGQPPVGYRVGLELHSEDYPTLTNRVSSTIANPDGTFRYDELPEGTYLARPVGGIYSGGEWYRASRQYTVTLIAGQTTYAVFDVGGTCSLQGHVSAPEGSARCVVCVYDPDQVPERPRDCLIYGLGECRIVGAEGDYKLPNLSPGIYLVTAYSSDSRHDFRRAQTYPIVLEEGDILEVNFDLTFDVAPGVPDVSLDASPSP